MKWHNEVPPKSSSRKANVADNTANPPAWYKHPFAFGPNFVELDQELLVFGNCAELIFPLRIFFQSPIRRRGNDEVHGSVFKPAEIPRVTPPDAVRGRIEWFRPGNLAKALVCGPIDLKRFARVISERKFDFSIEDSYNVGLANHRRP